jgi:arylformamidase
MALHDISVSISTGMPIWPGDPPVNMEREVHESSAGLCTVTRIEMGVHTGTHIDAPVHFISTGITVDMIPLGTCIGPCLVAEVESDSLIQIDDVSGLDLSGLKRILFKTGNSELWRKADWQFSRNFVSLSLEAAEFLVSRDISLVGIDYLSIEAFNAPDEHPVHHTLLGNGVVILEGLDLSGISPGMYELICLPVKIAGCDGAPVRAVLRDMT